MYTVTYICLILNHIYIYIKFLLYLLFVFCGQGGEQEVELTQYYNVDA